MRERTQLEEQLGALTQLDRELDDALTLVELGEAEDDAATEKEGVEALKSLLKEAQRRQIEALFSGEADGNDTFIEIHSGAGGTESQAGASVKNSKLKLSKRRPEKRRALNLARYWSRAIMPTVGRKLNLAFIGWCGFHHSTPMRDDTPALPPSGSIQLSMIALKST